MEFPGVEVDGGGAPSYAEGRCSPSCSATRARSRPSSSPDLRDDGYLPDDLIGKVGLEAQYEERLRGTYGSERVERDATGRRTQVLQTVEEAEPGASLAPHDRHAGPAARRAGAAWAIDEIGLKRGVVIAMNPQTGEILAMVSLPTYDNNLFARGHQRHRLPGPPRGPGQAADEPRHAGALPAGIDLQARHRHRRPGGRQDHAVDPADRPAVPDPRRRRGSTSGTSAAGAPATSTAASATRATRSSTRWPACSARPARVLGPAVRVRRPTGIDLPGEVSGIVPTNEWKQERARRRRCSPARSTRPGSARATTP